MSGTAAGRKGGQDKDAVSAEQEAQGLEPDRSEKEALAHRGGPLLKVAEEAARDENVVVIDSTEEAA